MQDGRSGEEGIRKDVAQRAEAQLVDRSLLVEQVEDAPDLVAVGRGQVQSGQVCGSHRTATGALSSAAGQRPERAAVSRISARVSSWQ